MFTAMSITPERRRIYLIGAAAATAAIVLVTLSVVRLSSRNNNTDKPLSQRQLLRLSPEERRALTTSLRQRADAAAARDLERAAELYTRALAAADVTDASLVASLYTNRACCYAGMRPPRHREVVRDCDAALALDSLDAMAVLRRSIAMQELKMMEGN